MNEPLDLIGRVFARLTVLFCTKIKRVKARGFERFWTCRCECGNEKTVRQTHLIQGLTRSCGCLHKEGNHVTHGKSKTRMYKIWSNMLSRCGNANHMYCQRGVFVCERWLSFENFFDDMGQSYAEHVSVHGEKNTTIDRTDNNGGYSIDNCRWATMRVQTRNTRKNRIIFINGEKMTMVDVAEKYSIPIETLFYRVKRGWPVEKLVEKPKEWGAKRVANQRKLS